MAVEWKQGICNCFGDLGICKQSIYNFKIQIVCLKAVLALAATPA